VQTGILLIVIDIITALTPKRSLHEIKIGGVHRKFSKLKSAPT
jgi:hypothetical protein